MSGLILNLLTSMDAEEGVGQKIDVHVMRMSMSVGFMRIFSSSSETAPDLRGSGLYEVCKSALQGHAVNKKMSTHMTISASFSAESIPFLGSFVWTGWMHAGR